MKRAVVTGSEGFVGTHLCSKLRDKGWEVVGIDLKNGDDIRTCPLPDADKVFHLAAQTDAQSEDAERDAETNVLGSIRVFRHYRETAVFASSSMVNYPTTPYAISKGAGEAYAHLYGVAIVRFCNLFGYKGHCAIDVFGKLERITIRGTGEQLRTYASVHDAVAFLLSVKPGQTIILPGVDLTVKQIAARFPWKPVDYVPAVETDIIDGRQLY